MHYGREKQLADRTVVARLKRQRELRAVEGWREVTVWVPTEQDAADIRKLAEERRAKAEALKGLSEEVSIVTHDTELRIAQAIAEQGAAAYTTPSGAVLTLLTELTEEGDIGGFSRAFIIFARAKPSNAAFIADAIPAKITNFLFNPFEVDRSKPGLGHRLEERGPRAGSVRAGGRSDGGRDQPETECSLEG